MIGGVHVLVVEDDVRMAAALRRGLQAEGIIADVAVDGDEAIRRIRAGAFDVVVLDVMLPDMDGFETCRRLRACGAWTPIIMLTARDAVTDRVRGLDSGADDYLTKPFSLAELLARLRALVRRGPVERPTVLEVGDLRLDPAARQAWRGEVEIDLTAREYGLFEAFMRRPGQVLSHLQLLDAAWDIGYEHRSNVIEVYVRYLREKIDRPFRVTSLETVRGMGYRLRKDGGR
jgi:two-component system, OmpR family, response regulator